MLSDVREGAAAEVPALRTASPHLSLRAASGVWLTGEINGDMSQLTRC